MFSGIEICIVSQWSTLLQLKLWLWQLQLSNNDFFIIVALILVVEREPEHLMGKSYHVETIVIENVSLQLYSSTASPQYTWTGEASRFWRSISSIQKVQLPVYRQGRLPASWTQHMARWEWNLQQHPLQETSVQTYQHHSKYSTAGVVSASHVCANVYMKHIYTKPLVCLSQHYNSIM